MNICAYCLTESNANDCTCKFGSMIDFEVFLEGVDLKELEAARDHWRDLPQEDRPAANAHHDRLQRFDTTIEKVKAARGESSK